MRSMINFLQSNQHVLKKDKTIKVLNKSVFDNISKNIKNMNNLNEYFLELSKTYNCDIKHIIKKYINYTIRNKEININSDYLNFVENILHLDEFDINHFINYFLEKMKKFIN